jgi:hypothetical protein
MTPMEPTKTASCFTAPLAHRHDKHVRAKTHAKWSPFERRSSSDGVQIMRFNFWIAYMTSWSQRTLFARALILILLGSLATLKRNLFSRKRFHLPIRGAASPPFQPHKMLVQGCVLTYGKTKAEESQRTRKVVYATTFVRIIELDGIIEVTFKARHG